MTTTPAKRGQQPLPNEAATAQRPSESTLVAPTWAVVTTWRSHGKAFSRTVFVRSETALGALRQYAADDRTDCNTSVSTAAMEVTVRRTADAEPTEQERHDQGSVCSTCGGDFDSPACSLNGEGWSGHTVAGNGGQPCANADATAAAEGLCRRCGWRPADGDGVCTICRTHADAEPHQ